jgi:hypothetical protein
MEFLTKLVWTGLENATFEHCTIIRSPGNILVQSKIEGAVNNVHTVVEYELRLTNAWIVYDAELKVNLADQEQSVKLIHNKSGEWSDGELHILPGLEDCMDIDISVTPFTNTLPVKRLCFKPGESRELKMVYIDLPSFELKMSRQRYTWLGNNRFIYEGIDTGYRNEITFNPEGFVIQYPGLFELTTFENSRIS